MSRSSLASFWHPILYCHLGQAWKCPWCEKEAAIGEMMRPDLDLYQKKISTARDIHNPFWCIRKAADWYILGLFCRKKAIVSFRIQINVNGAPNLIDFCLANPDRRSLMSSIAASEDFDYGYRAEIRFHPNQWNNVLWASCYFSEVALDVESDFQSMREMKLGSSSSNAKLAKRARIPDIVNKAFMVKAN